MPRSFQEQLELEREGMFNVHQPSGGYLTGYDKAALDQFGRGAAEVQRSQAAAQQAAASRYGMAVGQAQQQMAQGGRNPLAQRQAIMAGGMAGEQATGAAAAAQGQDQARLGSRRLQAYESELSTLQALEEADRARRIREQSSTSAEAVRDEQAKAAKLQWGASMLSDERLKMSESRAPEDEQDRFLRVLARSIVGGA